MNYTCTLTPIILSHTSELSHRLGQISAQSLATTDLKLRRTSLAKSLHATSAIEGNSLSLEQVSAILDGKMSGAVHQREVTEVRNAAVAYKRADKFRPYNLNDFLLAHKLLMRGLVQDAGSFRSGQVGIFQDGRVRHVAPPAKRVPKLVQGLFERLKNDKFLPLIVKSAIVHYEIEFIHPFSDGNGRMGRLWQHVLLLEVSSIFQYCPFESVIFERQNEYYRALRKSDSKGDAAPFVEFALGALLDAVKDVSAQFKSRRLTAEMRLGKSKLEFQKKGFSRKDYLKLFPEISTATASRDLVKGVELGLLLIDGEKALTRYRFELS